MPQNMVSSKISPKMVNESIILEHPSPAEILTYAFPHFKFLPQNKLNERVALAPNWQWVGCLKVEMLRSGDSFQKKTGRQEFFIMGI